MMHQFIFGDMFKRAGGKKHMEKMLLPFAFMLTMLCNCASVDVVHNEVIETASGQVAKNVQVEELEAGTLDSRNYAYPDGGIFSTERLTAETTNAQEVELCELRGEQGVMRWYDTEYDEWCEQPLTEGVIAVERPIIETDAQSVVVTLPQVYAPRENMMVEYMPDYKSTMSVVKQSEGWKLMLQLPAMETGMRAEWHFVRGEGKIIDWNAPEAQQTWQKNLLTNENRWCFDGYYYSAPSSYIPTGKNYFHLLIASYLTQSFMDNEEHPAAYYYAVGMLDTMLEHQNEYGYFPTYAGSQWLQDSYQIGAGFYDTRFNSDLVEMLIYAYEHYGVAKFEKPVRDYLAFYMQHAEQYHIAFGDGWMINDYSNPASGGNSVSSLNHQLAELLVLYEAGGAFHTDQYNDLAARMLRGIENSEKIWHKADGDLEYGIQPDGVTMHGVDYPYLTYDDLLKISRWRAAHGMEQSPAIERLLAYKLKYMQKHGITGYLK